ncbi:unnamed protein product [Staurois parvus]|uniref:Uncharacterized protein n=1 Tax=Staurois parvus TaxID=386267 RepID=A0ABN9FCL8_9NEOB|nr:unnamed protein product [Staurois parvus]
MVHYCCLFFIRTLQGQTDHLETCALPEGPGSVGGPMRCPWYLFIGFFEFGQGHRGPMIPYCLGAP